MKSVARAEARQRADRLDWIGVGGPLRAHLSAWLARRPPTTVLVYFALDHEPSIEELMVDPGLARHRWAAPRVEADGALSVRFVDGSIEVHRFGFRQPAGRCAEVTPGEVGVALVPGLVFDRWGGRLGHGKGHYDRLLPRLGVGVALVGVTAERLVRDERLPNEPHDIAVGWLATECGVGPVRPGSA